MTATQEPRNLEQVLERLDAAARDRDQVTIGDILESIGSRSFGPLLVVVGVIAASPLSGIPGMPTTIAVIVITVAVQLLFHKEHIWLPRWVVERSVAHGKVQKAVKLVQPPARFIDRLLKPRLTGLTGRRGAYGIAMICVVVAATMPPLELLPFAATLAGVALAAFGLALIARDGILGLFAIALTVGVIGFGIYQLFQV